MKSADIGEALNRVKRTLHAGSMELIVEIGSTAHGTGIDDQEDLDLIAIVMETKSQVMGLDAPLDTVMKRTQPEGTPSGPGDIDLTVYSLRKFVALAAAGNPSMLGVLWAPVLYTSEIGKALRQEAPNFVGLHVLPRYLGYMHSQAERVLGTKAPKVARADLIEMYGYDTKSAMHAARLGFQCIELMTTGRLRFPIGGEPGVWLSRVRRGDISVDDWWARVLDIHTVLKTHVWHQPDEPRKSDLDRFLIQQQLFRWQLEWKSK